MSLWKWSQTAASNSTADGSINWAEGQAPSTVNDSARAMMAATAKYRDDISGAITTGGTSTAYTVTSNQIFDTLAHMANAMIAFVPHATNTNTFTTSTVTDITLNVDGLGAKPIRMQSGQAIPGGALILGTPYVVSYNNSDAVFYLHNMANSYNIPLGAGMDYWGGSAPNSAFIMPLGQALNRTVYASLFSLFSTAYGTGDGSTTFNVPDLRGRVTIKSDSLGGSTAGRITGAGAGFNSVSAGGVAGSETFTLGTGNIPQFTPSVLSVGSQTITDSRTWTLGAITTSAPANGFGTNASGTDGGKLSLAAANGSSGPAYSAFTFNSPAITPSGAITVNQPSITMNPIGSASPTAKPMMPPAIVCNYILRVI